jgi:hypothetical protein
MYPPGYGRYQAVSRAVGHTPNPLIAKFAARYRFAGQLNSIEILGATEASQTAYLMSLRLALAYSALETLVSALQLKGSIAIEPSWVCWRFHTLETRMESWTKTTGQVEGIRLRRKLPRFRR